MNSLITSHTSQLKGLYVIIALCGIFRSEFIINFGRGSKDWILLGRNFKRESVNPLRQPSNQIRDRDSIGRESDGFNYRRKLVSMDLLNPACFSISFSFNTSLAIKAFSTIKNVLHPFFFSRFRSNFCDVLTDRNIFIALYFGKENYF